MLAFFTFLFSTMIWLLQCIGMLCDGSCESESPHSLAAISWELKLPPRRGPKFECASGWGVCASTQKPTERQPCNFMFFVILKKLRRNQPPCFLTRDAVVNQAHARVANPVWLVIPAPRESPPLVVYCELQSKKTQKIFNTASSDRSSFYCRKCPDNPDFGDLIPFSYENVSTDRVQKTRGIQHANNLNSICQQLLSDIDEERQEFFSH